MPGITINDRPVQITCHAISGSSSGINGYAVITMRDDGPGLTTQSGGTQKIQGPVYAVEIAKPPAGTFNLTVENGNLYEKECTPPGPGGLIFVPSPPYGYRCGPQAVPDPRPALPDSLPEPRDGTPAAVRTDPGEPECAIFLPGTYLNPPQLLAENYFVSGTYYFDNIGRWQIKQAKVYGGRQGSGEDVPINVGFDGPNAGFDPCAGDDDAPGGYTAKGTGVKFIFGGNSRLDVANLGSVELWRRADAPASEGAEGVSVHVVRETVGSFAKSTVLASTPVIEVSGGNQAELSMHGMLYAPGGFVDYEATNSSKAYLVGGVVAWRLHLQSSGSATGLIVSSQAGGPGVREVEIVARALGTDGDRDVVSKARVMLPNAEFGKSQVISWRNDVR